LIFAKQTSKDFEDIGRKDVGCFRERASSG
jgi:hypothetical protein